MNLISVKYATWKTVAQNNGFGTYHVISIPYLAVDVICGTSDIQYHASVDSDDYADWAATFSSSEVCASIADARAKVIGFAIKPPTPRENDGRMNVVNAPMSHGMYSWWTGAGDDLNPTPPASGRGDGTKMNFDFGIGADDQSLFIDFSSYVEIYDGEGVWDPEAFTNDDRFWVGAYIRDNQQWCTVNGSGIGNCNVVDTGAGFSIVVPADGDGDYDIDLTKATPAPAASGSGLNYWQVGAYIKENDPLPAVGDSGPEGDVCLFYDAAVLINFVNNMPMGSSIGRFEVDADKSEPIHKNWQIKIRCSKTAGVAGKFGIWLKVFRPDTSEFILGL